MSARFRAFVLFAEMRTGSNHLEDSLGALDGVEGFGEIFNPVFVGGPRKTEVLGFDIAARSADPFPLLQAVLDRPGMTGFRFFHDHDPRVLDAILQDRGIAKIVLTRNPLDSYVSLAIAAETGQWRLTNPKMARTARARFDTAEFDALVSRQRAFRDRLQRALQVTGQGAFWIDYDQIGDVEVLNGLAAYLGVAARLDAVPGRLKRQNPGPVEDKVENPEEMRAHLATLDPFLLERAVHSEPVRGPAVPTLMAAAESPLIALPVPGGPTRPVREWLTRMDGAAPTEGMTQRALRPWMRDRPGFVSFAILRHPLDRAHDAFVRVLAERGPRANTVRRKLANQHGVDLDGDRGAAFVGFLRFLKANLGGQSDLPVAPEWATQSALLAGMAQAVLPQRLIREDMAGEELDRLARGAGRTPVPWSPEAPDLPAGLDLDAAEAICAEAYRRDYLAFGFARRGGA
ncbi:nodulation protein NodH [Jannaschia sp. S6380]|uniref:nodulation protein NodH n=1 Tax=Jannaschia sp. S6380 TaxID=2926408 RepID=UPI001FF2003A|nr:nodulation protein NodH [Jannaschia sp. S6380]MCK0168534.1 nodulation protein NodH [Jannaschia sp. S6380]